MGASAISKRSLVSVAGMAESAGVLRGPLVGLLAAVAAGIVADRYGMVGELWWWLLAAGSWLTWVWQLSSRRLRVASGLLLLTAAATGGAWHHWCRSIYRADEVGLRVGENATSAALELVVASPLERIGPPPYQAMAGRPASEQTRFLARASAIRHGGDWEPVSGRVKVAVDGQPIGIHAGDTLRVLGQLYRPLAAQNPGEFDARQHDRADRTLCRLHVRDPAGITVIARGGWWEPKAMLAKIRTAGQRELARYIRPEHADLASAILLGLRESIPYEETQSFIHTGTIHLLVVAGLHVGMLAGFLLVFARLGWLPRGVTLCGVAGLTLVYAFLADANPPVIRATVLVVLVCTAAIMGRRTVAVNSLAAAGLIVLAINPLDLFRTGTQLSFLAVAALACASRWLTRRAPEDPLDRLIADSRPLVWKWARDFGLVCWRIWLAGALIWIVALPLVMRHYHLVTPVALLVNPLVALPAAIVVVCGFGVLAFSWLFPPLAVACGWACDGSLGLVTWMISTAERVPGSYFWVAGPASWWVLGTYVLLGAGVIAPRFRPPWRWMLALGAAWLTAGQFSTVPLDRMPRLTSAGERPLDCTFVSVGHGTAAILELPSGQTLMYDCGSQISPFAATRSVSDVLWTRGITHLDAVVFSHSDIDHYNGMPGLLERCSVGCVYVSPVMFRDEQKERAVRELHQALDRAGVEIREIKAGDRLRAGEGVVIAAMHPPASGVMASGRMASRRPASDNAQSVVLSVEYRGTRLLLPGDLEKEGLAMLLGDNDPMPCDVIMAPHHGSNNSHPVGFAAWSTPRIVVMSGGRGHDQDPTLAKKAYREAGSRVFHTGETGAVRVRMWPEHRVEVATYVNGEW